MAVGELRALRSSRTMTPETLERILDAIPGEPYDVKFRAFEIDYSCLAGQFEGALPGLQIEASQGVEFDVRNPSKDLVRRMYAAGHAWQERVNQMDKKAEETLPRFPMADFREAVWSFVRKGMVFSDSISVSPLSVSVDYIGSKPPYLAVLRKICDETGTKLTVKQDDSRRLR